MKLACPVCQQPLVQQDKNLRCENNHSFDAARQGYWNLLLVQRKRSRDPGDNAEMVQARRDFLDQGYYEPLSDQINQLAARYLDNNTHNQVLDMGCGEGYYTQRLQQHLSDTGIKHDIAALDISKHAIKAACQRSRDIQWLVASGADIPLPESSLDMMLVLFSRLMPEAFAKPLKTGGILLIATPGPDHLIELRKLIYKEIRESRFDPAATLSPQFTELENLTVKYPFTLTSSQQIATLLSMTPHSQRLPSDAREKICQQEKLELTLDVNLGVFIRQ